MILKVGLTGGIASGKSTICRSLKGLGAVTIDADEIVARLYRRGGAGHQALLKEYGPQVLLPDGEIDRKKVAEVAFADAEAAKKLNALIHPLVIQEEARIVENEASRFPDRDHVRRCADCRQRDGAVRSHIALRSEHSRKARRGCSIVPARATSVVLEISQRGILERSRIVADAPPVDSPGPRRARRREATQ